MGLNKSKKLAKKSVTKVVPEPVIEDEIEELDEVEEIEEEPAPAKKPSRRSPKKVVPETVSAQAAEPVLADDDDEDEVELDVDTVIQGIVNERKNFTSAVYQVQLRLPAEIEPLYKSLSPRLKKALRDAFAELVRKAYKQVH